MASRTDANQMEIVERLRAIGATVHPTHMVKNGFPDLVVGYCGRNVLLEVKMPGDKLNAREQAWHDKWKGRAVVVTSWEEAYQAIGIRMQ